MPSVCLYSCHVHPSTSLSLHCLYKFISLSSLWSQHSHQPSSAPLAAPVSAPQGRIPLLLLVFQVDVPQSQNPKSFLSHIRDYNDHYLCLVLGFVIKTKQTTKHLKHGDTSCAVWWDWTGAVWAHGCCFCLKRKREALDLKRILPQLNIESALELFSPSHNELLVQKCGS